MGIETRMLKQTAVYWPPNGTDRFGKTQYGAAVEIACRWEGVHELFLDVTGKQTVSNAKVYVGQDLELKGVLRFGTLADLTSVTDPFKNEESYTIQKYTKLPFLRATRFLRYAML